MKKLFCDGTVQNVPPDPFILVLVTLCLNSFGLFWNLWDFGIFFLVKIVMLKSESYLLKLIFSSTIYKIFGKTHSHLIGSNKNRYKYGSFGWP